MHKPQKQARAKPKPTCIKQESGMHKPRNTHAKAVDIDQKQVTEENEKNHCLYNRSFGNHGIRRMRKAEISVEFRRLRF